MTPELMRKDIDTVADCVFDYMNNDELTVMGMSWDSKYAGDYAARCSEKVDCFIGTSIALDEYSDAYIIGRFLIIQKEESTSARQLNENC